MKRLLLPALLLAAAGLPGAAPEYPERGPDIYDPQADGAALIDAALAKVRAERKHVLLCFGANWCVWCHRLHRTFAEAPAVAQALRENFIVVMIDVNKRHGPARNAAVNEKYGNPIQHGLPVLVVLAADGRPLVTQETGALEDGQSAHDPAKVAAFLDRWKPARPAR